MTNYNISIVSDTVCPWCYIGYRRLQRAISLHLKQCPDDRFTLTWRPFQLNPHAPRGVSTEKAAASTDKFGIQRAMRERLVSAGQEAGISFKFGGRTGNTLDSHRLLEFAKRSDEETKAHSAGDAAVGWRSLQTRLAEELFADYFEREQDITNHKILAKAAGRAGMDEAEALSFLAGDELAEDVAQEAQATREEGVSGVPRFILNNDFEIEGAQEPNAFLMLFQRLKRKESRL
jgi:predicted DsbA family dithiol-disulfide isomerase